MSLIPSPYPSEILDNLSRYSIGDFRTHQLTNSLRTVSEKKPPNVGHDPKLLMEYCQQLMYKLLEIRLLIEKKQANARPLTTEEFMERLKVDSTFQMPQPSQELIQKRKEFAENRLKLLKLNNDLKQLEWLLFTGDPFHIKKVDQMAFSSADSA
ncbi:hypothetical protein WR25_00756 [Diploscapter pachys]|uniref:Uncharacterized protein n=1 Tax=Diploscapter pachys TaxID=2018661 RepID=A0A2A2LES9_9BILA|nr:hypothetical protein WR25_00756 [Diploscapter pachys]